MKSEVHMVTFPETYDKSKRFEVGCSLAVQIMYEANGLPPVVSWRMVRAAALASSGLIERAKRMYNLAPKKNVGDMAYCEASYSAVSWLRVPNSTATKALDVLTYASRASGLLVLHTEYGITRLHRRPAGWRVLDKRDDIDVSRWEEIFNRIFVSNVEACRE